MLEMSVIYMTWTKLKNVIWEKPSSILALLCLNVGVSNNGRIYNHKLLSCDLLKNGTRLFYCLWKLNQNFKKILAHDCICDKNSTLLETEQMLLINENIVNKINH